MKVEEKIELYFFDPWKDEDKYTESFFQINNKETTKAYSPLYLMRRQVLLLAGKLIKFPSPPIWQTPYFSAILMANIAIAGLKDLVKMKREASFYKRYLELDLVRYIGLRSLRNALEHNNFQLYHRLYKTPTKGTEERGKWEFSKIDIYLKNNKKLNQQLKLNFLKLNYVLYEGNKSEIISQPNVDKIYNNRFGKYALITFHVWPFEFLERFENAVEEVKQTILNNERLKDYFNESITIDNWMKTNSK